MSENIDKWHQTFTEKTERKLWLMQQIAREKEIIGRLERTIGARERDDVIYKYEELRMEFSNEELRMIADYKSNRLHELQEELDEYRKREEEAKKKEEFQPKWTEDEIADAILKADDMLIQAINDKSKKSIKDVMQMFLPFS